MKIPGEYVAVSKWLKAAGVGELARSAHATPITREQATALVWQLVGVQPLFRGYRGRATKPCRSGRHTGKVTLPSLDGVRSWDGSVPHLRLGIVLHECAHVLAWRTHGRNIRPHGPRFCETFAELLRAHYRNFWVQPPWAQQDAELA